MKSIKVSVIIPVYNVEKYLSQCLESIVGQTLQEIEIICIDDGSTDGSLQILNEFAARDSRIRVVTQANAGAGTARNYGLSLASGEYLSFLDSDDFFEPDMLELSYEAAQKDRSDIVVFDSDKYIENSGRFSYSGATVKKGARVPYHPFNHYAFTDNTFIGFVGWAWDKLFRTEFIRKNELIYQEQRTTNDMLFVFSALVLADRISLVNKVLAHQRCNLKDSLSSTRERSWHCFYDALIALKENLISYGLMDELRQDYINYALHFSLWNLYTLAEPQKRLLYDKLKYEWFEALGLNDKDEKYFYRVNDYKKLLLIRNKTYDEYIKQCNKKQIIKRLKKKLHIGR